MYLLTKHLRYPRYSPLVYCLRTPSYLRCNTGMTFQYPRMNSTRLSQELFRHLSFIVMVFLPYTHINMCLNGFLTQSCAIHVWVLKSHTRVAPYSGICLYKEFSGTGSLPMGKRNFSSAYQYRTGKLPMGCTTHG